MSELDHILPELVSLLREQRAPDWANCIDGLAAALRVDPPDMVATKWLPIFGGMGSFNDLVLHAADGKVLIHENDTLDKLRAKLYEGLVGLRQRKP